MPIHSKHNFLILNLNINRKLPLLNIVNNKLLILRIKEKNLMNSILKQNNLN